MNAFEFKAPKATQIPKPVTMKEIKRHDKVEKEKSDLDKKDLIDKVDKKLEDIDEKLNNNMLKEMKSGFDLIAKTIKEALSDEKEEKVQEPSTEKNSAQRPAVGENPDSKTSRERPQ